MTFRALFTVLILTAAVAPAAAQQTDSTAAPSAAPVAVPAAAPAPALVAFVKADSSFIKLGAITVFAPSEAVLKAAGADAAAGFPALVASHAVKGSFAPAALESDTVLTSLAGTPINVTVSGDDVLVNGVKVVSAGVADGAVTFHEIAGVLPAAAPAAAAPAAPAAGEPKKAKKKAKKAE